MRQRRRRPAKKNKDETPTRGARVRCPLCAWEPDGGKHWQCDKCFVIFDTFRTRAHCPKCPQSWKETQCIACQEMSDHELWYVDEGSPL